MTKVVMGRSVCVVVVVLTIVAPVWGQNAEAITPAERANPVSPGGRDDSTPIESRCPTFSWTVVDHAVGYELVVYALDENSSRVQTETVSADRSLPHLRVRLPGRASSWTPSTTRCLEREKAYAWSVRALRVGEESEWSDAHLFEIQAALTTEELHEQMERLRSHLQRVEDAAAYPLVLQAPAASLALAAHPEAFTPDTPPAITSAAIQAQTEDLIAATAGIEAVSMSPAGVAGVFRNSGSGGQILSGQNATQEVFKLDDDGTLSAVKFVGDGSMLTGVTNGGGGGTGPVAAATNTVVEVTDKATLSVSITAPEAGGKLLVGASLDLLGLDPDNVTCQINVDNNALAGSLRTQGISALETCSTHAADEAVTQGPHTVDFVTTFKTSVGTAPGEGTLWVLWVAAPPAP